MEPNREQREAGERKASTIQEKSAALALRVATMAVVDDGSYTLAAKVRTEEIRPMMKELDRVFDPSIDAAKASLVTARAAKAEFYDPLEAKDKHLKGEMDRWLTEKARRQREEEAKRAAALRQQEEEKRIKAALEAEAAGHADEADRILDAPPAREIEPRPVTAAAVAPKVAGITTRTNWKFRVVDKSKVKAEFLLVDEVAIGKLVRTCHKDATEAVGGIEVWSEVVS